MKDSSVKASHASSTPFSVPATMTVTSGTALSPSTTTTTTHKPDLQGKLELMHLLERLKTQKRTGWVREGIKGPESIADHMYRMAMLSLLSEEDEELDIAKCVQMAVVHDLAEAIVGDIAPSDGISKEEKQRLEAVGGWSWPFRGLKSS